MTSNPSIDFFPFRVALSSVRLCTDGEEGRGKEGVKSGHRLPQVCQSDDFCATEVK